MTTIFPVIFGWIAQKYSTVPAVENVCENLSLVSRALEWNFPSLSVTKCGMSSALTQITVVPALTVKVGGSKVKLRLAGKSCLSVSKLPRKSVRSEPCLIPVGNKRPQ